MVRESRSSAGRPPGGQIVLNGPLSAVEHLQRWLEAAEHALRFQIAVRYQFKLRPDDIFIVTFPKSGTTLMQMIPYQLTTDGGMDFPHIDAVSPWIETRFIRGEYKELEDLPSPRVFKSHLPYRRIPKGVRCIYILRDLRSVAISAFHHLRMVSGRDAPLDRFIKYSVAGKSTLGS